MTNSWNINVSSLGDVNIWKYTDEATEPSLVFARSMIKGAWRDWDWAPVYRARDSRHGKLSSNILDKSGVMAEWKSLVSDMFTYFLIFFPNIFFLALGLIFSALLPFIAFIGQKKRINNNFHSEGVK